MLRAGRLLDLQDQDLTLDRIDVQLVDIAAQIGDATALVAARESFQRIEAVVEALEGRRKEADLKVQDTRAKREREEKKLYSGSVVSPKEIQNLQHEVEALRRRTLELEDRELAIMAELEEAEAACNEARRSTQEIEATWRDNQDALARRRDELVAQRAQATALRDQRLRLVDPTDLPAYDALRKKLSGRAVARIERGVCNACRVSLPEREIQKARTSASIVLCSNCGRILYAG
ncbi:MAG: hypothetical protein U0556_06115 [Dehalococcoidia bacterium]